MKGRRFQCYANCLPVKGARRSLLCDLQLGRIKLIPNLLYEILTEHESQTIEAIAAAYDACHPTQIENWFQSLMDEDWGFFCEEPQNFPKLDLTYETPSVIDNAVIDFDPGSRHDMADLIDQLEELGCRYLELRFYHTVTPEFLETILDLTMQSSLSGIELLLPHHPGFTRQLLREWAVAYPRLQRMLFHGAPEEIPLVPKPGMTVTATTERLTGHHHCGVIDPAYFRVNLPMFTLSQTGNNCLHKKIAVDTAGYIKNCPSFKQHFGNAADTDLAVAVTDQEFTRAWWMTKDQTSTCKDCEFRYICSDCKAFTAEEDNPYSKPAKCAYNPYAATWETPDVLHAMAV